MINRQSFEKTHEDILPFVSPSPLRYSEWLSNELNANVYLKLECMQPGNSFKIRGATAALLSNKRPNQVITASGGNHGLGVAIACKVQNISCKVVLPENTSQYRVQLLEQQGAEVELHGAAWDDANRYALTLADRPDVLYIHPFADEEVILGQGTIALELLKEIEFDVIAGSIGGGGMLAGIALALDAFNTDVEIIGVETRGADSMAKSLAENKLVELSSITSIAKTLGARKSVELIFNAFRRLLTHMLVVEDKDAVEYLIEFLNHEKILVEPATSCTVAAAIKNKHLFEGKNVVLIICGSNVSFEEVIEWKEQFNV